MPERHIRYDSRGFTLVEMAVVLVVIGLVVGSILVARDLIQAAEIRATISQIEKYKAAVNVFRLKYGGLPGDLTSATATAFGFASRSGAAGRGNGDGLVEGGVSGSSSVCGEIQLFWNDLGNAQLIDGSVFSGADGAPPGTCVPADTTADNILPRSKLGRGNYVTVWSGFGGVATTSFLYFGIIGGLGQAGAITTTGSDVGTRGITPVEAFQIDSKIDDGLPITGKVLSVSTFLQQGGVPGLGSSSLTCIPFLNTCTNTSATPPIYFTSDSSCATMPLCALGIQF